MIVRHSQASETPQGAVVLCHGFGAPGDDLVGIADELLVAEPALKDTVFVFPAAPIQMDPVYDSRAWWPIDMEKLQLLMMQGEFRDMKKESPERLPICRAMIDRVIEQIRERYGLSNSQIVVGGFSQGSMLTTDVMLNSAEPLGGLVIWSGTLLNESDWTLAAKQQSKVPIVQSHGTLDPILPFSGADALRQMLVEHGFDVEFLQFAGQHQISSDAFHAARKLMAKVCGT